MFLFSGDSGKIIRLIFFFFLFFYPSAAIISTVFDFRVEVESTGTRHPSDRPVGLPPSIITARVEGGRRPPPPKDGDRDSADGRVMRGPIAPGPTRLFHARDTLRKPPSKLFRRGARPCYSIRVSVHALRSAFYLCCVTPRHAQPTPYTERVRKTLFGRIRSKSKTIIKK